MAHPKASSGSVGFFQEAPVLRNQFHEDKAFQAAFNLFLPDQVRSSAAKDFSRFGEYVLSPEIEQHLASAEAHLPYLQSHDAFGRRIDRLVTSEGWRALQRIGQLEGIVAAGYEHRYGPSRRTHQYLKYHLWAASSAMTTCPAAMTDGAAALLKRHLGHFKHGHVRSDLRNAVESAFSRLTSRDPSYAWTSGQWMTERPGGSDVRSTETRASLAPDALPEGILSAVASDGSSLGSWRIDGFKWFSSATDANMSVLLAKTGSSDDLSLFFAPMRIYATKNPNANSNCSSGDLTSNGIQIQRLKTKLGTRPVPTAELVLSGMRAHILGEPGKGVREIATVLNITRINNAVTAMSCFGRGLEVSRAYTRVRRVAGGTLLIDMPAHVKGLAEQHVTYRADMLFTVFVVHLLSMTEDVSLHGSEWSQMEPTTLSPSLAMSEQMLRLLTPVLKATTALDNINGLRFCMESLGGAGYLEDPANPLLNLPRLFRDANVLNIWEGTTEVMGADMIRVISKDSQAGGALQSLLEWTEQACNQWPSNRHDITVMAQQIHSKASMLMSSVQKATEVTELLYDARKIMANIAWLVCAVLVVEEATRSGNSASMMIAHRWFEDNGRPSPTNAGYPIDWQTRAKQDQAIVFGDAKPGSSKL